MKYYLFIDECGDQNLSNFSPDFPIFTLCGIIVSEVDYKKITSEVNAIKTLFWGEKKVIIHSRDIRKCQNGFEILFDLEKKRLFYEELNKVMGNNEYTIVACSILKDKYIRRYGKLSDVYSISLSFIMERAVFLLDREQKKLGENIDLHIFAERRGKKEDRVLLDYYNELLDRGTYFVNEKRFKSYFKSFQFKDKRENIVGLQIADLVAYPITRFVLDRDAVNLSYEIIKDKIYTQNNKMHGLKIHPKEN